MSNNIYTMESANLICGDSNAPAGQEGQAPGVSTHLTLQELKLPGLQENYVDHYPGGARVGIEIPTYINKLEATFNLAGWQPEVMTMIGKTARVFQRFTAYGLIRDKRSGAALRAMAVMEGRLGRVNPAMWTKGALQHHEYAINSIVHYELAMQPELGTELQEIYYWDFFTSEMRVGGTDLNEEMINILSIPGVAI